MTRKEEELGFKLENLRDEVNKLVFKGVITQSLYCQITGETREQMMIRAKRVKEANPSLDDPCPECDRQMIAKGLSQGGGVQCNKCGYTECF